MKSITVQPGYTEAEVKAVMMTPQFVYADCFTITPLEGPPMRYTDAQNDVSVVTVNTVDRHIYYSKQVILTGLRARSTIGIEVDEQDADIAYGETHLFQNVLSWPQALKLGRLDGATVTRDRYVAAEWGGGIKTEWMGGFRMFSGLVSSLDKVGRTFATFKVKSAAEKLNIQMPRDLYQPPCKNVWGDTKCGVNQADFAVLGTVGLGATRTVIPWSSSDAQYGVGKIHISNSDDVTRIRTVLKATATHLYLVYPLDFDPPDGLEFTAYPGCNRSFARCGDFHANPEEHFGGFPNVPVAETAA